MPLRPCLGYAGEECSALVQDANRCQVHRAAAERSRLQGKRARRPYPTAERTRRAAVVAAHRARHGDWCPGWGVPAHPAEDLTADHVVPVGAGGSEQGELGVLCLVCNGRKGSIRHTAS